MSTAGTPQLLVVPFREVRHFRPEDSLHCEPIELRASQYGWTIPAHRHPELHQFQLLLHGRMVVTLDGTPRELTAPAALMVAPGTVHGFVYATGSAGRQVSVPSATLAALAVHSPGMAERLARDILIDLAAPGRSEACARHFDQLGQEFAARHEGRADALGAHATLLALWFVRHAEVAGNGADRDAGRRRDALRDTLVQRFRTLVERHFLEHRPLGFYAETLGVTVDHLSRVCRAATRTSALDIVHARLALEARRMLAHTDGTIAAIALQLGFADAGYFSRFFKAAVGTTPSAHRDLLATGLVPPPPPPRN
ncbi:MAG TPA: helix-turn-helix domain-containing protein [Variovorax sp.]|nr:helix-turn-helix domain-containing protein [Variovorax sp.]